MPITRTGYDLAASLQLPAVEVEKLLVSAAEEQERIKRPDRLDDRARLALDLKATGTDPCA